MYIYLPCCPGRGYQGDEERGRVLAVEGLHAVLRPTRAAHRPHLHLPRADEQVLQARRVGGHVRRRRRIVMGVDWPLREGLGA